MMVVFLAMSLMACGGNALQDTGAITAANSSISDKKEQASGKYTVEEVGFVRDGNYHRTQLSGTIEVMVLTTK